MRAKIYVLIVFNLFQKFDIWPVLVRVDYSPCHVDLAALSGGKYVELVNIVPWKVNDAVFVRIMKLAVRGLTFESSWV
jgi:hypothetical protein